MVKSIAAAACIMILAGGAATYHWPTSKADKCEQATLRFEIAMAKHKAAFDRQMAQLKTLNAEHTALMSQPQTLETSARLRMNNVRYLLVIDTLDPTPPVPPMECH